MRFAYTIVYVADVRAAVAFYGEAFGFAARFVSEAGDYGELETGATALSFAAASMAEANGTPLELPDPARPAPGIEIAFATEDVAAAWARALAAGATAVVEPSVKPWGQTVAYVRDPFGVLVEICTPMA
jgi:uncharacterized glyoxalase superfamily protein PhnB